MSKTPAEIGGWDVHCHLIPEPIVALGRKGAYGLTISDGRLVVRSSRVPLKEIATPDLLSNWVSENQLAGGLVSPPPPLFRPDLSSRDRWAWTDIVNSAMADMCQEQGWRLRPYAYLPIEDPAHAAAVVRNLDDAWVGTIVGTELNGQSLADPSYDQLWRELSIAGLPMFIHPGECHDPRLDQFYLRNLIGNPYETGVAVAQLIFGGVLDRFPDLTVILAHGGGIVPSLVGRWERGYATNRPGIPPLDSTPIEAVRRFYADTVVHTSAQLDLAVSVFGKDHLLLGSDWPFPMGHASIRDASLGVEVGVSMLMGDDNARRALRIS